MIVDPSAYVQQALHKKTCEFRQFVPHKKTGESGGRFRLLEPWGHFSK